ncbi:MAG TPA: hypothetical protein VMT24_10985, partial [Aggregatilineaceae bacterium]|nr:hypothetical protein [Aggregatilineaceae bacterium]
GAEDIRIAGFGPWYGGVLLLSIGLLILLTVRYRRRLVFGFSLLIMLGAVVVSTLSNSEAWWVRYVPQLWLVPVLIALLGLILSRRRAVRYLSYAVVVLLLVNAVVIAGASLLTVQYRNRGVIQQLEELRTLAPPIPIVLSDQFVGVLYRLDAAGIRYTVVDTLPCTADRRIRVLYTSVDACPSKQP